MLEIAMTLLAVAVLFGALGALALLLKLGSLMINAYRKRVYKTALYIAREHPDLLSQVAELMETSETAELELEPLHTGPITTIQTAPRRTLEQRVAQMEDALWSVREKWLDAEQRIEALEQEVADKDRLRLRYWNRIKRVVAAEADGADIFPVLHPFLARQAA